MSIVRDRAICLRLYDFSETSQVVSLFTRETGRLKVIAKGSRRRSKAGASGFDGGLDLLDLGEAVFRHTPEKELSLLTAWNLQDGHLSLRKRLRSIRLGLYAGELVGALIEQHDPHPHLFDRLAALLGVLPGLQGEAEFAAFVVALLRETGDLPELVRCVRCGDVPGDGEKVYFSAAAGGLVCQLCEGRVPDRGAADPRVFRLMLALLNVPETPDTPDTPGRAALPVLTRRQVDPLHRMIADHIERTIGGRLRLAPLILEPLDRAEPSDRG